MPTIDAIAIIRATTQPTNIDCWWDDQNIASTQIIDRLKVYDSTAGEWKLLGQALIPSSILIQLIDQQIAALGPGEANEGENVGGGIGVYKGKVGVNLQFKTLTGTGVAISQTADEINFAVGTPTLAFTDLTDVPSSYVGQGLKAVRVNGAEAGLEFFDLASVATTGVFTSLTDVPSSYVGQALKATRVNAGATALEFFTLADVATAGTFLSLTDTPATYVGQSLKAVRVNAGETALEFVTFPSTAITLNYIPQGTGTSIVDGTWQFSGNDILPNIAGSNIGSASNYVGTIFLGSTLRYASNLIFSEAGSERARFSGANLGIGTTSPGALLAVVSSAVAGTPSISATTAAYFQNTATTGTNNNISIISGNAATASLFLGDNNLQDVGRLSYDNSANSLTMFVNSFARIRTLSSGYTAMSALAGGIGHTPLGTLHLQGEDALNTHYSYLAGGTGGGFMVYTNFGYMGFRTLSPLATIDLYGDATGGTYNMFRRKSDGTVIFVSKNDGTNAYNQVDTTAGQILTINAQTNKGLVSTVNAAGGLAISGNVNITTLGATTGVNVNEFSRTISNMNGFDHTGDVVRISNSGGALGRLLHLVGDDTLLANRTDAYAGGMQLSPTYNGAFTVTRHNYFDVNNVVLLGGAALTDAFVFRYDAAPGTHAALDAGTTKTSPGTVDAWEKKNVSGTTYYSPMYTSKTT